MKKTVSILACAVLLLLTVAGCGGNKGTPNQSTNPTTNQTANAQKSVKTGLGILSSISGSKSAAGTTAGVADYSVTMAAVTIDASGKITKCVLDGIKAQINFTTAGKLATDIKTTFKTKQELKDSYGMKKASSIGKEWYQEADAFAAYVVGKTLAEVKGIARDSEGKVTDSELKSSVTVSVGGFIDTIEKAVTNAKDYGAKTGDMLGMSAETTMDKSLDAKAGTPGLAQLYPSVVATTFDSANKVTSCVIDAVQVDVKFDATGKVTSNLNQAFPTKNELGAAYGMKKASSIGKEWNEQARAFADYVAGKTVAEIKGIALNQGVPAGAELKSKVTIHVSSYISIIEKTSLNKK